MYKILIGLLVLFFGFSTPLLGQAIERIEQDSVLVVSYEGSAELADGTLLNITFVIRPSITMEYEDGTLGSPCILVAEQYVGNTVKSAQVSSLCGFDINGRWNASFLWVSWTASGLRSKWIVQTGTFDPRTGAFAQDEGITIYLERKQ